LTLGLAFSGPACRSQSQCPAIRYDLAWLTITAAGILGAGAIFLISSTRKDINEHPG